MTLRYMYTVSITTLCLLSLVFYHCVADIGHWMAANRLQMNPTKTELLWAGSKHITMLGSCAAALQLGSDTVTASYHVRVLGVTHFVGSCPREACFEDLCSLFLLAAPTLSHSAVA